MIYAYFGNKSELFDAAVRTAVERMAAEVAAEPMESYLAKTVSVTEGRDGAMTAVDLLVIIYAIAQAWTVTPVGLLSADGSDPSSPERIARHRLSVVAAVAAIVDESGCSREECR